MRFLSLYFHQGIFSQPLLRYEERFFYFFNSCLITSSNTERGNAQTLRCEIKRGRKRKKKMKKLIMCCIVLTCAAILSGCGNSSVEAESGSHSKEAVSGNSCIEAVEDFYAALRTDDRKKSDEMVQKVVHPFFLGELRSDRENVRDLKKIFPKIRKSKEKVVTEVVKEEELQGGRKKSIVRATSNSITLYFDVCTEEEGWKIIDITKDRFAIGLR